jgi:hypothetical protein
VSRAYDTHCARRKSLFFLYTRACAGVCRGFDTEYCDSGHAAIVVRSSDVTVKRVSGKIHGTKGVGV